MQNDILSRTELGDCLIGESYKELDGLKSSDDIEDILFDLSSLEITARDIVLIRDIEKTDSLYVIYVLDGKEKILDEPIDLYPIEGLTQRIVTGGPMMLKRVEEYIGEGQDIIRIERPNNNLTPYTISTGNLS
jgi:hypothetical protein